MGNNAHSVVII